jgi:hypothetical protein
MLAIQPLRINERIACQLEIPSGWNHIGVIAFQFADVRDVQKFYGKASKAADSTMCTSRQDNDARLSGLRLKRLLIYFLIKKSLQKAKQLVAQDDLDSA